MKQRSHAKRPILPYLALGLCLTLALAACSLAEDITPPPGIELTEAASIPTPAIPTTKPNPANGAAVYAQHCLQCHGAAGKGDGPMAGQLATQRTEPLPDFSDPTVLQGLIPQDLFATVTQGRIDQFMPPFSNVLSEAERWDAIAFLYTLSQPDAMRQQGQTVFETRCAACHGAAGKGDGPQSTGALPDLSAPQYFVGKAEDDFFKAITTGLPNGASSGAHTFADLPEADRRAVAAYVRALAFDTSQPVAVLTPTPLPDATTTVPTTTATSTVSSGVVVSGAVTNGTASASLPADLKVELYVFDQFQIQSIYTTTMADGRYTFTDVPLQLNQAVLASTTYAGLRFGTDIVSYKGTETSLNLPLEIFETTSDPGVIRISRWHIVFSVTQPGQVQVGELLIISNVGDRVFVAPAEGQPALNVPLPAGATNLQFQDGTLGERYQMTSEGFGDNSGLRPGQNALNLLFSFDLPLKKAVEFSQAMRYPVDAINVLAPEVGLQVKTSGLSGPETQSVQGGNYLMYTGASLSAGSPLTLTLTSTASSAATNWLPWVIGLVVVLALAGVGVWWWLKRRPTLAAPVMNDPAQRRAELIEALAQLDVDFAQGEYDERDYQRRRARLKAEALEVSQPKERTNGSR